MEQGWSQLRPGQIHLLAGEREKGAGNVCFSQTERKDNFCLKQVRQKILILLFNSKIILCPRHVPQSHGHNHRMTKGIEEKTKF